MKGQVTYGNSQNSYNMQLQERSAGLGVAAPYSGGVRAEDFQPKHSHYFKPCPYPVIDIYRVIDIFEVTHPCAQHVTKKILVTGKRGHKDLDRDIQDMIDTLKRWQDMRNEEGKGK